MTRNLVFSNPVLENSFRRAVHSTKAEIGGWFCVGLEPKLWPGRFSWRRVKAALKPHAGLGFIEAIILVPNESEKPAGSWWAWDFEKAGEMAKLTAKMYGAQLLHFHTHPTGDETPSPEDFTFAGARCKTWEREAQFCIVTPRPLRLWPYSVRFGNVSDPHAETSYTRGRFWSWRMEVLKQFREAV